MALAMAYYAPNFDLFDFSDSAVDYLFMALRVRNLLKKYNSMV